MEECYKKNPNSEIIKRACDIFVLAKKQKNKELMQIQANKLYQEFGPYIYYVLWESYPTLMRNPDHREDLSQEVWACVMRVIPDYDPNKGSITTFLQRWIKNAVTTYYSENIGNTSTYYSDKMRLIKQAQNMCSSHGIEPSIEILQSLTNIPESTIRKTLKHIHANSALSYDSLTEIGLDQKSKELSPENLAIKNDMTKAFNDYLQETLTERELQAVIHLVNPNNSNKKRASYREIARKMNTHSQEVQMLISRATMKLWKSGKVLKDSPLASLFDGYMGFNQPIIDDEKFIDEQLAELKDFE